MAIHVRFENAAKKHGWYQKVLNIEEKTILKAEHMNASEARGFRTIRFPWSEMKVADLHESGAKAGVCVPTVIYAAWTVLLQRYLRCEDVLFAVTDEAFAQAMLLRAQTNGETSLDKLVKHIQKRAKTNSQHALSLPELIQNIELQAKELPFNTAVTVSETHRGSGKRAITRQDEWCDLHLQVYLTDAIEVEVRFRETYFQESIVAGMCRHLERIVATWLEQPQTKIREVQLLSDAEVREIAVDFNDTQRAFSSEQTIISLFEQQVAKAPEQVALVFRNEQMSYRVLDEKANEVAMMLIQKGVPRGGVVGILAEPSLELVIGILGILKAGAAYVPLDVNYPQDRIRMILEDSQTGWLLTRHFLQEEPEFFGEILPIVSEFLDGVPVAPARAGHGPSDLAYMIYTSGSTGTPKGVMVGHRSLVNLAEWHRDAFAITSADRATKYAGVGFDASVWEIFPYLISGAALHMIPEEIRLDAAALNRYFNEQQITISFLPTQLCEQFMELDNRSLRVLLTGGDKLKKFKPASYKLINCYGPTENTVVTTSYEVTAMMENIPIGKPVYNAQVLIVDACNQLQPIGIPGELCIAGDGLAHGYWNRPDLTEAKFVPHALHPEEKMYRTGDLARWLPDGTIEFLGRIDHQVKIRGFRIETGEIEHQLLQHTDIREVVVAAREDQSGTKYLCAYYVAHREVGQAELTTLLAKTLPPYMIPAQFMQLAKLPVNANGKVDLRALPDPTTAWAVEPKQMQGPSTETEKRLAKIWKETLGVTRIGVRDDFFQFGGHSLLVAQLQNKIEQRLQVRIPVTKLFEATTIQAQARLVQQMTQLQQFMTKIVPVGKRPFYPASPAQKRLYLVEQMQQVGTAYNAPMLMRLEGRIDKARMVQAFETLLARHDALRTSFAWHGEELVQVVQEQVPFAMQELYGTEEEAEQIMEAFVQPFDLQKAPLFRAGLLTCAEELHFLLLDFHHIVVDGVSLHVFFDEWTRLYHGDAIPERSAVQFADYAVWQGQMEQQARVKQQEPFWQQMLAGEMPVLQLPTDRPRPATQSYRGTTRSVQLDRALTEELRLFAKESDATLFMVLFAAYNTLLARYANQEDLIVGVPVANRNQADVQAVIGMFVNTLPVRSYPAAGKTFGAYLQEVKQGLLAAFDHQEYELEQMVQALNIPRDPSRNPLFDTMFVMQNTGLLQVGIREANVSLCSYFHPTAKYDLVVHATEEQDAIRLDFEYATDLFDLSTVERFSRHLVALLQQARSLGEQKLSDLRLLSDAEVDEQVVQIQQTESAYERAATIHQLFETQVEKTPERVAVQFDEQALTYRELNERANRLATTLRGKGVQRDQVVGLLVDRSLEMIVGLLGILKAGGAYVPIDPEYPQDRVAYMLEHSGAQVLLTQSFLQQGLPFEGFTGEVLCLDQEDAYGQAASDADNLAPINGPHDLLYVIYTSGTTGKPKGVMIEHQNLVNLLHYEYSQTNVDYSGKVLQFTTMSFDVCSQEIWSTLLAGGTLCMISNETKRNIGELLERIEAQQINVLFMPVSLLKFVLHEKEFVHKFPRSVRHIITAGEQLIVPATFRLFLQAHGIYLHNHYGPSETHVCTALTLDPHEEMPEVPPIGRPVTNSRIYILNESLQMQPFGVAGEIYIAGDCVGRGYLNNQEMTDARYLPDPFVEKGRMYKSGDLGKWNPDGTVEYLGRLDHQVKIRGFRIELGEVESHLLNHAAISETIVIAREDGNGGKYLCAYYVAAEELSVAELRSHLAQGLPEYMIPSYFVWLASMPITPNGKIDRRALPQPDMQTAQGKAVVPPSNEMEWKIAAVWQDVLNVAEIGIHDNFFELGGHSLKAAVVVTRLQKEFELSMNDLFACQTVALLAGKVKPKSDNLKARLERLKHEHAEEADDFTAEMAAYAERNQRYAGLDLADKHHFQAVLLTGATGYVGIHLLQELLHATTWDVHVIVRGQSQADATERLHRKYQFSFGTPLSPAEQYRLHVHVGDLTHPQLGLEAAQYEGLAQMVDCVINSAATVKHYGDADTFAKLNVDTTLHLLDLARHGKKKVFHHISTLGVATGRVPERAAVCFTEDDLDVGQQFENYYAKSKWEAELAVVNARQDGLDTNIHRLGNVVFHSETGRFQENIAENAFYTLLNSFVRFGQVPVMAADVDFSYVDVISRAVVTLVGCKHLQKETYHLYNNHQTRYSDVLTSAAFGSHLEAVSFATFLDELYEKSEDDAYKGAVSDILLHFGWLEETHHLQTRFQIRGDKTNELLARLGVQWEPLQDQKIGLMFKYGHDVRFWD